MSFSYSYFLCKLSSGKGFLLINAGHRPHHHHHLLPFAEELVMDLKYHDIICVSPLWTYALHREDEGVAGLICHHLALLFSYHVCIFHQRTLGMCGRGTLLRVWFQPVRYQEANLYWKVTLGAGVLSAVRKREASACVCTTIMLNPIRNTTLVRCREVICLSEGP